MDDLDIVLSPPAGYRKSSPMTSTKQFHKGLLIKRVLLSIEQTPGCINTSPNSPGVLGWLIYHSTRLGMGPDLVVWALHSYMVWCYNVDNQPPCISSSDGLIQCIVHCMTIFPLMNNVNVNIICR